MKPVLGDKRVVGAIKRISASMSDHFLKLMREECKVCQFTDEESLTISQLSLCFLVGEMSEAAVFARLDQEDYVNDIRDALRWDAIVEHRGDVRRRAMAKIRKANITIVKGKK